MRTHHKPKWKMIGQTVRKLSCDRARSWTRKNIHTNKLWSCEVERSGDNCTVSEERRNSALWVCQIPPVNYGVGTPAWQSSAADRPTLQLKALIRLTGPLLLHWKKKCILTVHLKWGAIHFRCVVSIHLKCIACAIHFRCVITIHLKVWHLSCAMEQ